MRIFTSRPTPVAATSLRRKRAARIYGRGLTPPRRSPWKRPNRKKFPLPLRHRHGVDNATDADGKEFFTITTPAENVFYLVIDRQRETENVYFLNAVTEADLLALAEISEEPITPNARAGADH